MSLVGPRPLPLRDNELLAAWHKQRHVVLPGMTGLWQVRSRSDTSFDEMIDLDLLYIDSVVAVARPLDHAAHRKGRVRVARRVLRSRTSLFDRQRNRKGQEWQHLW